MTNWDDYKEEILQLKEMGLGSRKIAKHFANKGVVLSDDSIRQHIAKWNKTNPEGDEFEETLRDANFQFPENWDYGWLKSEGASVFIRNGGNVVSFEEMREDFINELRDFTPTHVPIKREKITEPHLLVVDLADLHIGKLAVEEETGDGYSVDVAVKRATKGVSGILDKAGGFPIDKILFVVGNDILHTDNAGKTTTKGTPQDVDGKWWQNYVIARKLYVGVITSLLEIADVHIVHNPSNHDYVTGFMLADSLSAWFRNSDNVTFDIGMAHRKYFKYGVNLIGTTHGDGAKLNDLPLIMANEAKQDWADTAFRYIYLHHLHHNKNFKFHAGNDYHGANVQYLRSPSGADSWHHKAGYSLAPKAVEGFVHHKEYGQVARLIHLFK